MTLLHSTVNLGTLSALMMVFYSANPTSNILDQIYKIYNMSKSNANFRKHITRNDVVIIGSDRGVKECVHDVDVIHDVMRCFGIHSLIDANFMTTT